jgi:hypothetical protein
MREKKKKILLNLNFKFYLLHRRMLFGKFQKVRFSFRENMRKQTFFLQFIENLEEMLFYFRFSQTIILKLI